VAGDAGVVGRTGDDHGPAGSQDVAPDSAVDMDLLSDGEHIALDHAIDHDLLAEGDQVALDGANRDLGAEGVQVVSDRFCGCDDECVIAGGFLPSCQRGEGTTARTRLKTRNDEAAIRQYPTQQTSPSRRRVWDHSTEVAVQEGAS
jgi:hypothetical protein